MSISQLLEQLDRDWPVIPQLRIEKALSQWSQIEELTSLVRGTSEEELDLLLQDALDRVQESDTYLLGLLYAIWKSNHPFAEILLQEFDSSRSWSLRNARNFCKSKQGQDKDD